MPEKGEGKGYTKEHVEKGRKLASRDVQLARLASDVRFALGDLALEIAPWRGHGNYDRSDPNDRIVGILKGFASEIGIAHSTLGRYRKVAFEFPVETRSTKSPWSVHWVLKDEPDRVAILAERECWDLPAIEERVQRERLQRVSRNLGSVAPSPYEPNAREAKIEHVKKRMDEDPAFREAITAKVEENRRKAPESPEVVTESVNRLTDDQKTEVLREMVKKDPATLGRALEDEETRRTVSKEQVKRIEQKEQRDQATKDKRLGEEGVARKASAEFTEQVVLMMADVKGHLTRLRSLSTQAHRDEKLVQTWTAFLDEAKEVIDQIKETLEGKTLEQSLGQWEADMTTREER